MSTSVHWFLRARLKTRQLLLLVTLAEEGNIHRAAQVLNMTQPAASKLLKDLEDVLEVPLFERLPRGMRPTWYGETMIRHARVALGSLNQAHDELQALKAGSFGQVRVGAITSPGLALLPPAVAAVKREQPNLRVSLEIETSPVLLERLEQGKLDILVARLFEEHDKSRLRYEALTQELVCGVVRPGHPLLGTADLTLRDVVDALGTETIFADVPHSAIAAWHKFQVWDLRRQLEQRKCMLYTLDQPMQPILISELENLKQHA